MLSKLEQDMLRLLWNNASEEQRQKFRPPVKAADTSTEDCKIIMGSMGTLNRYCRVWPTRLAMRTMPLTRPMTDARRLATIKHLIQTGQLNKVPAPRGMPGTSYGWVANASPETFADLLTSKELREQQLIGRRQNGEQTDRARNFDTYNVLDEYTQAKLKGFGFVR